MTRDGAWYELMAPYDWKKEGVAVDPDPTPAEGTERPAFCPMSFDGRCPLCADPVNYCRHEYGCVREVGA